MTIRWWTEEEKKAFYDAIPKPPMWRVKLWRATRRAGWYLKDNGFIILVTIAQWICYGIILYNLSQGIKQWQPGFEKIDHWMRTPSK